MKIGRRGNLMGISQTAIAAVVTVITIIILISVYSSMDTNARSGLTGPGASAAGNFSQNTFSGFQSLSILPTIVFAALLLGALGLLYVVFQSR